MQRVDAGAVLCFALVFVLSVVAVPFEDSLYFAYRRVPDWWYILRPGTLNPEPWTLNHEP
jgi:hypothetical protein